MITRHLPSEATMERLAEQNEYGLSLFYSQDKFGNKSFKKGLPVNRVKWTQVNNVFAGEDKAYLSIEGCENQLSITADYNKGEKLQNERGCAYHVWYDVKLIQYYDNEEHISHLSTRCLYKALSWVKELTGSF